MSLIWNTSFPLLRLKGRGVRVFLQGQTSADINAAVIGEPMQACWLTATGRLRAVLEIRLDSEGADVLILAGDADAVRSGFDQVIFPADRVRLGAIRQQNRIQELTPDATAVWIDDADSIPQALAQSHPATALEIEQWRVQEGFPPGPGELSGDTNPLELGLADRVSTSKGCYLGQETMAKLVGNAGVKQQLRTWRCLEAVAVGDRLEHGDERAGVVTTAVAMGDSWVGLALVRRLHLEQIELSGPADQILRLQRPRAFQGCDD